MWIDMNPTTSKQTIKLFFSYNPLNQLEELEK